MMNTSYLINLRHLIEERYKQHPTGAGNSFGEILCYEIHHGSDGEHEGGLTFNWLAKKWRISVTTLGALIYDHCQRLEGKDRTTLTIDATRIAREKVVLEVDVRIVNLRMVEFRIRLALLLCRLAVWLGGIGLKINQDVGVLITEKDIVRPETDK